MRILSIETSCDETAVAILEKSDAGVSVLGAALISQIPEHAPFGGVVPNIAKREHSRNLVPVLLETLRQSRLLSTVTHSSDPDIAAALAYVSREHELGVFIDDFLRNHAKPQIDAIAVTHGPGLEPALWVGINFAKALAAAWHLPLIPVNHLEGHIAAALVDIDAKELPFKVSERVPQYPAACLIVSGGHTELITIKEDGTRILAGRTRDDAAGECFDKSARLLGLPYPGGPEISRLAQMARDLNLPELSPYPRPMSDSKENDFSFSGLKTSVLRNVQNREITDTERMQQSRAIEEAIVETLVKKTMRHVATEHLQSVLLGGGVAANPYLRKRFAVECEKQNVALLECAPFLATDNAIMIGLAAILFPHGSVALDLISAHGQLPIA